MALAGTLRTMAAGDLLQWLGMARKSGTLVVTAGEVEKKIFLRDGRIVSTASNDPADYLGQFLVSWGYITEDELRKAMEVQRESKVLLGKILVTIGVIEERDLLRLLRLKAEEEVYSIFLFEGGEFRFDDDDEAMPQMVPLHLDPMAVVMEGLRRIDEWKRIRDVIPGPLLVPVVVEEPDLSSLTDLQKGIVHSINGSRSIEEIVLESRSSEFVVSRTIFDLVQQEKVRLDPPKQRSEPEDEKIGAGNLSDDDELKALTARAQKALKEGDWERALRTLRAAQSLDPTDQTVRNAMRGAETVILGSLKKDGLGDSRVPKLRKPLEELAELDLSPNEGFIISRINGTWDIGSIVKISPMREIDALMIFKKLVQRELIEF